MDTKNAENNQASME